jgi:hypothetical protein
VLFWDIVRWAPKISLDRNGSFGEGGMDGDVVGNFWRWRNGAKCS